jgi:hypothetical protein
VVFEHRAGPPDFRVEAALADAFPARLRCLALAAETEMRALSAYTS